MKDVWIIYNGFYNGSNVPNAVRSLEKACLTHELNPIIIANSELIPIIENNIYSLAEPFNTDYPLFVLFWDKDIRLAEHLEKMKLRVYNSSQAIEFADNKAISYQKLTNANIPIPKTIIAPFQYPNSPFVTLKTYMRIANEIGYPLIIKECFGTFGHQVYYIEKESEMLERVQKLKETPFLFQQVIHTSIGRDVRIQVVGDKCVASMLRFSGRNEQTAITQIGNTEPYQPSQKEQELAIAATKALGLEFAGVDLLFGENGDPIICEVNSNGNMQNLFKASGIDASLEIVSFLKNKN